MYLHHEMRLQNNHQMVLKPVGVLSRQLGGYVLNHIIPMNLILQQPLNSYQPIRLFLLIPFQPLVTTLQFIQDN